MCDMGHIHDDHERKGFGFHFVQTVSDKPSISIHLLANDTACIWRHKFDPASGEVTPFRSGYVNAPCPPDTGRLANRISSIA